MFNNKAHNNYVHNRTQTSAKKLLISLPKRAKSFESSMSERRKKIKNHIPKDLNVQSKNIKRYKHHQNYYQNGRPPSSLLSSHDTDYSNKLRTYQHNSDRIFGQIPLKLSTLPLFEKILNLFMSSHLLIIIRLIDILVTIKIITHVIKIRRLRHILVSKK